MTRFLPVIMAIIDSSGVFCMPRISLGSLLWVGSSVIGIWPHYSNVVASKSSTWSTLLTRKIPWFMSSIPLLPSKSPLFTHD